MKSSIYISSEKIEVIRYSRVGKRVSVKDYITAPLPEGVMMNGKIFDPPGLVECLSSLRKKRGLFADSSLVVDGSSIITKRVIVPKLNKRQYDRLVMDEFADTAGNFEELVCDYHPMGKAEGVSMAILACAADKAQVQSYISTFQDAGIRLKSIHIGVQAIFDHVNANPNLKSTSFVLNVVDGVTMLSMIFENGVNVFMSRTRLYGDNYEQLIQNILENLSGLIQFNKSQKFDEITSSYYWGLTAEDLAHMRSVSPYGDINLDTLDIFGKSDKARRLPPDAHFAFLNALLDDNSINLINSLKNLDRIKRRQKPKKLWIPALILVIALLAAPAVYLRRQLSYVNADLDELNAYMTDKNRTEKLAALDEIMAETGYYAYVIGQIDSKTAIESSYAAVSNQVLDLITRTHVDKVRINKFDFNEETQIMRVSGSSTTENDSADYVESLKRSGLISDVYYTGYSYNSDGEYNFSIDVKLEAKGGVK